MSTIEVSGSTVPSGLQEILCAEQIVPGSPVSYGLCKQLWALHPLAGKIVEKPISLALGKKRIINVPCAIEDRLVKAFEKEWKAIRATRYIRDLAHISRVYGVGALVYGAPGKRTDEPIPPNELYLIPDLYINILDPLNTSGSMVTNQDPNAPDYQKQYMSITANGQPYHKSRTITLFNGTPIYLDYQGSSFSFSGRSVFLRALFPLKSFIQTMIVNDMVSLKAGLLIAKMKQGGSVLNRMMEKASAWKRNLLQEGRTNNVLTIDTEESIETIDLTNVDGPMTASRDNIISDCAAATDTPAILLKDESFAKGLASGDQDMLAVVQHIDNIREELEPAHEFFDRLVMHRAWNPEFYAALQKEIPELAGKSYDAWFYEVRDLFTYKWPNLIQEPESETVKRNAEKLKAMVEVLKALLAELDPPNRARLVDWFVQACNDMPEFFTTTMEFDPGTLATYEKPQPTGPGAPGEGDGGESEGSGDGE
jgi:hypothetical protein